MDAIRRLADDEWKRLLQEPIDVSEEYCDGVTGSLQQVIDQVTAWKLLISAKYGQDRVQSLKRLKKFLKTTFTHNDEKSTKQKRVQALSPAYVVLLGLLFAPWSFYRLAQGVFDHLCRDVSCFIDERSAELLLLETDIRTACRGLNLNSDAWSTFLQGYIPHWHAQQFANDSSIQR